MRTIHFEDQGQDFLEWDIDSAGVVVGCRPFQASVWEGSVVRELEVGKQLTVFIPHVGETRQLRYLVERIECSNPFMNAQGYGSMSADDRIRDVQRFDLAQCQAALTVPGLQKTVEQRLRSRIRKLEKESCHG